MSNIGCFKLLGTTWLAGAPMEIIYVRCSNTFTMIHVALYQPVIPPNTGNVARQCVGMSSRLHLIGPMRFDVSDTAARRAGLDHWEHLDLVEHADPDAFLTWLDGREPWLITKHGGVRYDQGGYRDGDVLVFGSELHGLPETWHKRWPSRTVYVPILGPVRSYNLGNTVSIVLAQASLTAGLFDRHVNVLHTEQPTAPNPSADGLSSKSI